MGYDWEEQSIREELISAERRSLSFATAADLSLKHRASYNLAVGHVLSNVERQQPLYFLLGIWISLLHCKELQSHYKKGMSPPMIRD